jgi:succinate dehydrogenase / fumarate reductase membrane anchor subunit
MSEGTSSNASIRTALKRVRGLGASGSHATSDFWWQRVTAVGMLLLTVPVIIIVMMLLGRNQAGAGQILGTPVVALIMLLLVFASRRHKKIGMQVVI